MYSNRWITGPLSTCWYYTPLEWKWGGTFPKEKLNIYYQLDIAFCWYGANFFFLVMPAKIWSNCVVFYGRRHWTITITEKMVKILTCSVVSATAQCGWLVPLQRCAVWEVEGVRAGNVNIVRATFWRGSTEVVQSTTSKVSVCFWEVLNGNF